MYRSGKVVWPFYCCDPGWSVLSMYRKIYSHANSIRVMMMMMMIPTGACCVQYSAVFVPATPSEGSLPQPLVVHFLLLTLTIPSGALIVQACRVRRSTSRYGLSHRDQSRRDVWMGVITPHFRDRCITPSWMTALGHFLSTPSPSSLPERPV